MNYEKCYRYKPCIIALYAKCLIFSVYNEDLSNILYILQALLLLNQLTKSNANIQKIVAFENAFERLLDIVDKEEGIDGGM